MTTQPPTHRLSELLNAITVVVDDVFAGPHWITAELAAVHAKNKGYWVLELHDHDDKGQKLAQTQAFVWANNVARVVYKFERATKQKLSAGMRVRVRAHVSFHPQWGMRLTVDDIDTSWTLGEAQANNQRIRDQLTAEGLWGRNQALPTPVDFYRVAVVAPDTSAGLEDFVREADVLHHHGLTAFDIYAAAFEGNNAAQAIPRAFAAIAAAPHPYDVVCIVRGGGAASGLAWLNNEHIVRAVCSCPVPVLSGIGHERDHTLVDDVANVVCGTPSKTIQHIVGAVVGNAQTALRHWSDFQHAVQQRVADTRQKLDEHMLASTHHATTAVLQARRDIEHHYREAVHLGPSATLQRGYAIVRPLTEASQSPIPTAVATSAEQARTHHHLRVQFHDGHIDVQYPPSKQQ